MPAHLLFIAIVAICALLVPTGAAAQFEQERAEILRRRMRLDDARAMETFYRGEKRRAEERLLAVLMQWKDRFHQSECSKERTVATAEQARFHDEACRSFEAWAAIDVKPVVAVEEIRIAECESAIDAQVSAIFELQNQLDGAIANYIVQVGFSLAISRPETGGADPTRQLQRDGTGARPGTIRHTTRVQRRPPPVRHVRPGPQPFRFPSVQLPSMPPGPFR